ncbi:ABC transporter substrate-binding protein [Pseudomonas saliphila]|uniref:ABC transporter substrate-binding protein n=1 Tax=Pseudomonas saliphila TaxID=2586906 RepID=UPI0015B483E8|nr:ABC transporter substrate-binding protein [Pseudomonas saliphila]
MTFINPGLSTEPYWIDAMRAMRGAATSLDVQFEILHAERDFRKQISLVSDVAERPAAQRPDYLIIAGEKGTLAAQLELAEAAGIPVFLAFNSVRPAERPQVGHPRGRFSQWLGSLTPNAEEGGYLSARALFTHTLEHTPEQTSVGLIAIAGDRSTDTALKRNQGLQRALAEFPQVQLYQMVNADWSRDKAAEQAAHLYRRYPDVRMVWGASDQLAFGAMQSLRRIGGVPGQDVFFSGINSTDEGLRGVIAQELTALAGGHHLAGAWSIVLLHDHYHGLDFYQTHDGHSELEYSMFSLQDARIAQQLIQRRQQHPPLDFCSFSMVCDPLRQAYDFSFDGWLKVHL